MVDSGAVDNLEMWCGGGGGGGGGGGRQYKFDDRVVVEGKTTELKRGDITVKGDITFKKEKFNAHDVLGK